MTSELWLFALSCAAKALVLLALCAFVRSLIRRSDPAKVHLVWIVAFAGVLCVPFLSPVIAVGPSIPVPGFENIRPHVPAPSPGIGVTHDLTPSHPASTFDVTQALPTVSSSPASNRLTSSPNGNWMLAIWALGSVLCVLRILFAFFLLRKLHRCGSEALAIRDMPVDASMLALRTGVSKPWELRITTLPGLRTAITWGVARPIVLLPMDARGWNAERLEAVIIHELAHVRRKDFASQLLAEVACALYWFNPFVWLGARAMRMDAESAADEAVLRAGVKPSAYASVLLQIAAEIGKRRQALAGAGIPAMTQSKIESRVKSVLSSSKRRRGITTLQALATFVLSAIAVGALASLQITSTTSQNKSKSTVKSPQSKSRPTKVTTKQLAESQRKLRADLEVTKKLLRTVTKRLDDMNKANAVYVSTARTAVADQAIAYPKTTSSSFVTTPKADETTVAAYSQAARTAVGNKTPEPEKTTYIATGQQTTPASGAKTTVSEPSTAYAPTGATAATKTTASPSDSPTIAYATTARGTQSTAAKTPKDETVITSYGQAVKAEPAAQAGEYTVWRKVQASGARDTAKSQYIYGLAPSKRKVGYYYWDGKQFVPVKTLPKKTEVRKKVGSADAILKKLRNQSPPSKLLKPSAKSAPKPPSKTSSSGAPLAPAKNGG